MEDVKIDWGTFDTDEETEDTIKPLINEAYDYANIVNNPILKPISECDKSVRDLEEMKIKYLKDSKKLKSWVNLVLEQNPEYNLINIIVRLTELLKKFEDIVKLDGLQIDKYRDCIIEGYKLVRSNYAVRGDDDEYYSQESKIDKVEELDYLKKVSNNKDPKVAEVGNLILQSYQNDSSNKDTKKKFNDACIKFYSPKTDEDKAIIDLEKKKIIARILRREY